VRAAILALSDLLREDVETWRELAAEAAEPNPFFEPEYVLPAAQSIGGRQLALLVVLAAGEWLACLPIHRPRRWHRVPFGCVAGWHHKYCFLGTPLVRPDRLESALATMARELMRQRRAAFVGLDSLADGGPVRAALRTAFDGEGRDELRVSEYERALLRRRATEVDYMALKAKNRRELERKRRRLEDDLDAPLQTVDRAEDATAVDEFMELEASGWKGQGGTAVASLEQDAEFFRTICRSFRELGRLHLISLQANGQPVAMACNLRAGEGVFCIKIAFDERWRRSSPGAQLVLDHVSWFHRESNATWMDSCVQPGNELVSRLWPDRRRIVTLALPAKSATGRMAGSVIRRGVRLRYGRGGAAPSHASARA
jgi:CelD/BcsL family acetyltransferase involved in cellulose biosynthesis